jgi:hypothetical protein
MRRHPSFSQAQLTNPNNNFSLKVLLQNSSIVEIFVPQYRIVSLLQDYIDKGAESITIYFSNSPIYAQIAEELVADRNLNFFQKLKRLEARVPHLYYVKVNKHNYDNYTR